MSKKIQINKNKLNKLINSVDWLIYKISMTHAIPLESNETGGNIITLKINRHDWDAITKEVANLEPIKNKFYKYFRGNKNETKE